MTWILLSNGTVVATDNKATERDSPTNNTSTSITGSVMVTGKEVRDIGKSKGDRITPTYTPTAASSTTVIAATRTAKASVTARARSESQDAPIDPLALCPAYNPTPIPTQPNGQRELTGFYVYLDPGHGGKENHAQGPGGTLEKCWVLNISLDLGNILRSHGAQVFYSRTDDSTIGLTDRYQAANRQYRAFYPNTTTPVPNGSSYRSI